MQVSGGAEGNLLEADGAIQISGGRKVLVSLAEIWVEGHQGVGIAMNGADGSFKVDDVIFDGTAGSIAITSSGPKALVEMHNARFWLRDNANFTARLAGAESAFVLKEVSITPRFVDQPIGDVTLEAGSGSAPHGKIEASGLSIWSGGSIAIRASLGGEAGVVKLDASSVRARREPGNVPATGDIVIETGPNGTTEVKMGVTERASVRVASGPGGSCVWQDYPGHTTSACSP